MASANLKGCHEIQNLGAVQTYQRRYLYVLAFEIVEHDVLDLTHDKNDTIEPKINSKIVGEIKLKWMKKGYDYKNLDAQILKIYNVPLIELTQAQAHEFLKKLSQKDDEN
jgi:hypothetical protein